MGKGGGTTKQWGDQNAIRRATKAKQRAGLGSAKKKDDSKGLNLGGLIARRKAAEAQAAADDDKAASILSIIDDGCNVVVTTENCEWPVMQRLLDATRDTDTYFVIVGREPKNNDLPYKPRINEVRIFNRKVVNSLHGVLDLAKQQLAKQGQAILPYAGRPSWYQDTARQLTGNFRLSGDNIIVARIKVAEAA